MAQWFVSAKKADFEEIGKKFGISPVLARLIRNRDVVEEEEIEKYLYILPKDIFSFLFLTVLEVLAVLAE